MRILNRHVQILVLLLGPVATLPAQRHTDDDWLRLRAALKADAVDTVPPRVPGFSAGVKSDPNGIPLDAIKHRVLGYACALGAPPALVLSVAEQESHFEAARGQSGEIGIMQVMPETARMHGLDPARLWEVDYGIYAGIVILLEIMREFSSEDTVLGVYNAGLGYADGSLNADARGRVARYIEGVQRRKSKYASVGCL